MYISVCMLYTLRMSSQWRPSQANNYLTNNTWIVSSHWSIEYTLCVVSLALFFHKSHKHKCLKYRYDIIIRSMLVTVNNYISICQLLLSCYLLAVRLLYLSSIFVLTNCGLCKHSFKFSVDIKVWSARVCGYVMSVLWHVSSIAGLVSRKLFRVLLHAAVIMLLNYCFGIVCSCNVMLEVCNEVLAISVHVTWYTATVNM